MKEDLKNETAVRPRNITLCAWRRTFISFLWKTFLIKPGAQHRQAARGGCWCAHVPTSCVGWGEALLPTEDWLSDDCLWKPFFFFLWPLPPLLFLPALLPPPPSPPPSLPSFSVLAREVCFAMKRITFSKHSSNWNDARRICAPDYLTTV